MIIEGVDILGYQEQNLDIMMDGDSIITVGKSMGSIGDQAKIRLKNVMAFPGLINSHDHLHFNLYPLAVRGPYQDYVDWSEDVQSHFKEEVDAVTAIPKELRYQWGCLKNLMAGFTTVLHHDHWVEGLSSPWVDIIQTNTIHSVRLESKFIRKLNANFRRGPIVIHIGEGINEASKKEIAHLLKWNLLRRKLIGIHGIAMNREEAAKFKAMIWCPISNLNMFGQTADISALKEKTNILFGSDSCISAEWDIWKHIHKAHSLSLLSDVELYEALHDKACDVWKLPKKRKFEMGSTADIVVAKNNKKKPNLEHFFNLSLDDILLVVKGGKIMYFDQSIKKQVSVISPMSRYHPIKFNDSTKYVPIAAKKMYDETLAYVSADQLPMKFL